MLTVSRANGFTRSSRARRARLPQSLTETKSNFSSTKYNTGDVPANHKREIRHFVIIQLEILRDCRFVF